MIIRSIICVFLVLLSSAGCGLIYKQNIQQGNALEQDELDELYIGMNQRQVLFVLGTPSIKDPFQPDRWDYVQTFSRRGGDIVQRTVTLRFEDGLLSEIIGQNDPFAASGSQAGISPAACCDSVSASIETGAGCPVRSARARSRACFIRSIIFSYLNFWFRPQVLIITSAFLNALYQSTSSGVQK